MRGAGGISRRRPDCSSPLRPALRVRRSAKTNRIRDDVEGKGDIDQRGKSGGSPDDRPVVERAFRAEERSDHREYLLVERLRGSEAFVGRF